MRWNKSNLQIGDNEKSVSQIPKNSHIMGPLIITIFIICTYVLVIAFYRFAANRRIEKALVVVSKDCFLPDTFRPSTNDVISSLRALDRSNLFLRYSDQCSNVVSIVYRGKGRTYEIHRSGAVHFIFQESIDTNGLFLFESFDRCKIKLRESVTADGVQTHHESYKAKLKKGELLTEHVQIIENK